MCAEPDLEYCRSEYCLDEALSEAVSRMSSVQSLRLVLGNSFVHPQGIGVQWDCHHYLSDSSGKVGGSLFRSPNGLHYFGSLIHY
jgi:hypothetical protein